MKSESREALKEKAIQKAQASMPPPPQQPEVSPAVREIQEQLYSSVSTPIQGTLVGDNNRDTMRGPSLGI
jgi:hypothetical protein